MRPRPEIDAALRVAAEAGAVPAVAAMAASAAGPIYQGAFGARRLGAMLDA